MSGSTLAKFVIFIFLACWVDFCECLLTLLPPKDVFMFLGLFPSVFHFFPELLSHPKRVCQLLQCFYVVDGIYISTYFISTYFPVLFLVQEYQKKDFRGTFQKG